MVNDAMTNLLALLSEQRACLKSGRLADLSALAERIEMASVLLQRQGTTRRQLVSLAEAVHANAPLIRAAVKGVEAAQARLLAIRSARDGLSVYTADGRALHHAAAASAVERRS